MPVQFRTVGAALAGGGVDLAITVADDLPAGIHRQPLFHGGFVCLFDPRRVKWRRAPTEAQYFARDHVVVSYNGDLRGIVEDVNQRARRVRCSVSSFANLGALIDGSSLVATVPELVARQIRALRPRLRTASLPFPLAGAAIELLWPAASDDDLPGRFLRAQIAELSKRVA
jgi:LysR family transcriptional activator of mexEF-oprN operon